MSGSSFNYLFAKEDEQLFLVSVQEEMEYMADELEDLDYKKEAEDTRNFKKKIENYNQEIYTILNNDKNLHKMMDWEECHEMISMAHLIKLRNMIEEKKEDDEEAAEKLTNFLQKLEAIQTDLAKRQGKLSPVWRAVEWYRSGDSGKDAVEYAIKQYRAI